jgi:tetratricopeptide (TPR) repeat protein
MKRALSKIVLLVSGIIYAAALFSIVRGEWAFSHSTIEKFSEAVKSSPRNPKLWKNYASFLLHNFRSTDRSGAVNAFLEAIALNPLDPANWDGLASAYLEAGDPADSEAALRAWLVAIPRSPDAAWRLGNLLILEDRAQEAFPYLKAAGEEDPRLRTPLFDVAWKLLADPQTILNELIPSDPEVREAYLFFLLQTNRVGDAGKVWSLIRGNHTKQTLNLGYLFDEHLIMAGKGEEAASVWNDLLTDTVRAWAKPAGELMTNGDFEAGLPNRGLDWRFFLAPGFQIRLDGITAQNGTHSLRVSFDGTANPDFSQVSQDVPVEPNHAYQFHGYIKTENISSDSGLRFALILRDPPAGQNPVLLTENRLGTNPWTLEQVDFRTGPATHFVNVTLHRMRSSKLYNLIQGSVWIDNVSIKPRP